MSDIIKRLRWSDGFDSIPKSILRDISLMEMRVDLLASQLSMSAAEYWRKDDPPMDGTKFLAWADQSSTYLGEQDEPMVLFYSEGMEEFLTESRDPCPRKNIIVWASINPYSEGEK